MHELREGWRAAVADAHLRRVYHGDDFDDTAWEPIAVPGHWRSTPAFAESDGPLLHRCLFETDSPVRGRRRWLTFDGVFYQGDVWLDGGYLGDTEGYFVPHTFEITDQTRDRSQHVLAIEATCAPERSKTAKRNVTGVFQHWDCLDPTWNPGGIWRPVWLSETGPVRIARLRMLCREATPERAVVAFRATLDSDTPRAVCVRTELGDLDHELTQPLAAGANELEWTVTVERPRLWWPRALGEPTLHDVSVAVLLTDGHATPGAGTAHASDVRRLRTGLRSVRLRRWICSVNGERLFLKGANHGPTRMALAEASPDELRADVGWGLGAGLDLLRVHAHVSRPQLYDAADERGLLLWQDLPLQWGYARGVRKPAVRQAREAIDLLGHHPSIAVWCGHNEPMAIGTDAAAGGEAAGVRRSALRMLRFVGEFGAQAVPSADEEGDGAAFCEPDRWPDLDWARLGERHNLQKGRFDRYVPPAAFASFDDWRQATQRYQAELIRRHVEVLRRLKYRPTGGFAQFCLADGHPRGEWG